MTIDFAQVPGITPELIALLTPLVDKELSGIVSNRDDFKIEKQAAQDKLAEAELLIEVGRKAAVETEEQRLVDSGKYKEALELRESELATAVAVAQASEKSAKEALTSRDRGDVMSKVMGLVHPSHKWNSEAMLSNMLEIGYNDQNQLTTKFKHNGEVVANNVDEFKSWAGEQDSFKMILNGVDSSGAGTTQSTGSASGENSVADAALAKGDVQAYLKATEPK